MSASNNVISQVFNRIRTEYTKKLNKKLLMVDSLIIYSLFSALIQLVYVVLVGSFPFNSFLSGFLCQIGLFSLGVSLRLQLSSSDEFKNISPEKAFGDFAFCCIVFFFIVFSFLG